MHKDKETGRGEEKESKKGEDYLREIDFVLKESEKRREELMQEISELAPESVEMLMVLMYEIAMGEKRKWEVLAKIIDKMNR